MREASPGVFRRRHALSEEEQFINDACCGLVWEEAMRVRTLIYLRMNLNERTIRLREEIRNEFSEAQRKGSRR